MTIAEKKIQELKDMKTKMVIKCILHLSKDANRVDETEDVKHVNTFTFIYDDDSEAKIDMDGDLYDEQNYEDAYNIFQQ